jgi:hypothetical protein
MANVLDNVTDLNLIKYCSTVLTYVRTYLLLNSVLELNSLLMSG